MGQDSLARTFPQQETRRKKKWKKENALFSCETFYQNWSKIDTGSKKARLSPDPMRLQCERLFTTVWRPHAAVPVFPDYCNCQLLPAGVHRCTASSKCAGRNF